MTHRAAFAATCYRTHRRAEAPQLTASFSESRFDAIKARTELSYLQLELLHRSFEARNTRVQPRNVRLEIVQGLDHHRFLSASTPGKGLPSSHSRKAPPAVET